MRCACGSTELREVKQGFRCDSCGGISFWNPPTVAAGVVPVEDWRSGRTGVLLVERRDGGLAFPGGYQGREDVFAAVSREVEEETGVLLPEEQWEFFDFHTTPDFRHNLFFALHTGLLNPEQLASFEPNDEVLGLVTATGPMRLRYPLHERVLRKFFELQHAMERSEARLKACAYC